MKILIFDPDTYNNKQLETVTIQSIAFAGIYVDSEPDKGDYVGYICFECIDDDRYLIKLKFSILIPKIEADKFDSLYGNLRPTGLLGYDQCHASLSAIDLFRKNDNDLYSLICMDNFSTVCDGNKLNFNSYKVFFTIDKYVLISKYISDILNFKPVDYFSLNSYHLITEKSTHINIKSSKYKVEVIQVNYPDKSKLFFKKNQYSLEAMLKFINRNDPNDWIYSRWTLGYNDKDTQEILKHKKFHSINSSGYKVEYPVYVVDEYIAADFAINANSPMEQIIMFAYNDGMISTNYDAFAIISINKNSYTSFLADIFTQLIS